MTEGRDSTLPNRDVARGGTGNVITNRAIPGNVVVGDIPTDIANTHVVMAVPRSMLPQTTGEPQPAHATHTLNTIYVQPHTLNAIRAHARAYAYAPAATYVQSPRPPRPPRPQTIDPNAPLPLSSSNCVINEQDRVVYVLMVKTLKFRTPADIDIDKIKKIDDNLTKHIIDDVFRALKIGDNSDGLSYNSYNSYTILYLVRGYGLRHLPLMKYKSWREIFGMSGPDAIMINNFCISVRSLLQKRNVRRTPNTSTNTNTDTDTYFN